MKAKLNSKIMVRIPDETHAALTKHQEKTGVPVSEFVRRAIVDALKKREAGQ